MRRKLTAFVCAVACLAIAVGCESTTDDGRREVIGSVTFNGQPVEEGQIVFEPEGSGPLATGQIKAGKYEIDPKFGPAAGGYRVRIEGYRKKKVANMPPHPYAGDSAEPGMVAEQFLPSEYNTRTTLRVDVAADEDNIHNFDLKSRR